MKKSPRNSGSARSRSQPRWRCSTAARPCRSSPAIARRRPAALDDAQLRTLDERLRYLRELEERRTVILNSIREQGKLDDALEARDPRRRQQGPARRHLSAVQAEASHQGADRQRGRSGAARRSAAGQPETRPAVAAAALSSIPRKGRRRRRGARRRAVDSGRKICRGRRPDRLAARGNMVGRPPRFQGAGRKAGGRRQIQRLFRFRREAGEGCRPTESWRCFAPRRKRSWTLPSNRKIRRTANRGL